MERPVGSTGGHGECGLKGETGIQGCVGAEDDRGERSERSVKGKKGIQGGNSDVLSVLGDHLPIQLATRYGEKMCFLKYHVSEDRSCIIELSGGVGTLRNVNGNATIIKQTCPKLVYSVEQRKALELMTIVEEKCPIAQRDGL